MHRDVRLRLRTRVQINPIFYLKIFDVKCFDASNYFSVNSLSLVDHNDGCPPRQIFGTTPFLRGVRKLPCFSFFDQKSKVCDCEKYIFAYNTDKRK